MLACKNWGLGEIKLFHIEGEYVCSAAEKRKGGKYFQKMKTNFYFFGI